jgi:hypothetical protein
MSTHSPGTTLEYRPIRFGRFDTFYAGGGGGHFYDRTTAFLLDLITQYHPRHILEVGSGAHPALSVDVVREAPFSYTTNDVSETELGKANPAYQTLCLDICDGEIPAEVVGAYDLIFSRMVNEHVKDGRAYYRNIFTMLYPGGITAHCFSTLYSFPFLMNRIMPEFLSRRMLDIIAGPGGQKHDKFKAYYSWSRGPSPRMIRRFQAIGFRVIQYAGYFGHDYYHNFPLLDKLERMKSNLLASTMPIAALTSYACLILQKPPVPSQRT